MRTTAHNATTASTPKAGPFATLCAFLHVKGTGASKTSGGTGVLSVRRSGRTFSPLSRMKCCVPALLCAVVGLFLFTSAPALAAGGHEFKESFTGEGTHKFSDPSGVAINNATGNVYVVDKGNNRVEEFNPTGTKLEAEFNGSGTSGELAEPEAIAIDNSGETQAEDPSVGDVYVTDHGVVDKFEADGTYLNQITGTCETAGEVPSPSCKLFAEFEGFEGVAVDPQGQVWVYRDGGQIDAFSDAVANAFLSSRESAAGRPQPGFAVDSEDNLYVDHGGILEIAKLNSKGETLETPSEEGRTGVAVEPVSNDVYIDNGNPEGGTPKIQVYSPKVGIETGKVPIETFGEAQLADHGGTALAVSYANVSSGDVYVVDSVEGKVDIFTRPKATAHAFSSSFSGSGVSTLSKPAGVAVNNETGDVYVVDKGNDRVEYFNATGTYEGEFNGSGLNLNEGPGSPLGTYPGRFENPEWVAVDNDKSSPSYGDVYVTDNGHGVVDKFSATGEYKGQIAGACEKVGEVPPSCGQPRKPEPSKFAGFGSLVGVAVDPKGVVWIGQAGHIDAFNGEEPNSLVSSGPLQLVIALPMRPGFAVDSEDTLYFTVEPGNGSEVVRLDSAGKYLSTEQEDFGGEPNGLRTGIAVDLSSNDVFLDYGSSVGEYTAGGSPIETFGSGSLTAGSDLAVNFSSGNASSGAVYVADSTANDVDIFAADLLARVSVGAVSALTPTSVTLEGSVDPEGREVSSCEFEYGTTTAYGQSAPCETEHGEPIGEGTNPVLVATKLKGLPSGTTYHYRLVASDSLGTNRGSDHEVKTIGPEISAEEVNDVEAKTATLQAQINPNGAATSYRFEYDTTPYREGEAPHGTSLPVPNASAGAGTSPVPVSVKVQGLQSGETYYYRAVAESELHGTPHLFYGEGKTFATPSSPPAQNCPNEQLRAEQPFGLALPDCRAYEMVSPEETGGQDATDSFIDANARAAESSANPAITYASKGSFGSPTGAASTDQFVSRRNAAKGLWETQAITPLWNPEGTHTESSFDATVFEPELKAGIAATDASLPGSGAPESLGGAFGLYMADFASGSSSGSYRYMGIGLVPDGASIDLSHVVFGGFGEGGHVSEWVDGEVVPVSVTNEGAVIKAEVGAPESSSPSDRWHAVSANGSRVYFSSPEQTYEGAAVLYGRENAEQPQSPLNIKKECTVPTDACTIEVSASQRLLQPNPAGTQPARYWGASADGSKVFFTSNAELTEDAYTGLAGNGANLYEYDLETGKLNDLTREALDGTGDGADVQGVVQISEDGSYVYFVADGKLAGGAVEGEPNLYVSHDEKAPTFIATLEQGDKSDWNTGARTLGGPQIDTAVVNPSGTELAFVSERRLTGYDNQRAATGQCEGEGETGICKEVYLYQAQTGGLVCVSCNPTGARPVGPSSFGRQAEASAQYRPRDLLADGTLFFDSSDALVPHASDGRLNVYEYEDGHVSAISNVAGGGESFFLDASSSGEDVFFGSANKLLPQDTGDNVVVWDARQDGGFPFPVAAPACMTAEACRAASPSTPAVFGAPPSATFSGPGNVAAPPPVVVKKVTKKVAKCKKGLVKNKKGRCVKKPKKKNKAKKSAHINRRASR